MSVITHHTALPDTSEKTDFYSLVDNATCTGIVDADCASSMALSPLKLATITTAGKVDGSAINNLANIPAGAGVVPVANLPISTMGVVPSGGIIDWSGSIVDAQALAPVWYVCDGTNGTPDLRDRFIMTAGSTYAVGDTGDGSIPAHTHTIPGGNAGNVSGGPILFDATDSAGTPKVSGSFGIGTKVIATYYALAKIMKS